MREVGGQEGTEAVICVELEGTRWPGEGRGCQGRGRGGADWGMEPRDMTGGWNRREGGNWRELGRTWRPGGDRSNQGPWFSARTPQSTRRRKTCQGLKAEHFEHSGSSCFRKNCVKRHVTSKIKLSDNGLMAQQSANINARHQLRSAAISCDQLPSAAMRSPALTEISVTRKCMTVDLRLSGK